MLNDRERKLLVEIEHRLLLEAPELVRSFEVAPPYSPHAHHHGATVGKVAGLTLRAVLWRGPLPLSEAEVAARGMAGPSWVMPKPPGAIPFPVPRGARTHETRGRT